MSDEQKKPERTIENVKSDFNNACFRAGQIQYQIYAMKRDLEVVNKQLIDLNFEAAAIETKGKEKPNV